MNVYFEKKSHEVRIINIIFYFLFQDETGKSTMKKPELKTQFSEMSLHGKKNLNVLLLFCQLFIF